MHITHQQEEFSRAFVHAIASAAGYKIQPGASPDDDSVDLTISDRGPRGVVRSPRVDVQLKCRRGEVAGETLSYRLKLKNYEDLRPPLAEFQVPRVLVLVTVPEEVDDWATHAPDALILKHRAYWVCLHGAPATSNAKTVTIEIPAANEFTKGSLTQLMERVGRGERP